MRKFYKVLFFTFLLSGFCTQAQVTTKDEKRNIKQPPNLVQLDNAQKTTAVTSRQLLTNIYQLEDANNFKATTIASDRVGFKHETFLQTHKGVKVEFAQTTVHSKNGNFNSISGEVYDIQNLDVTPKLSQQVGFQRAVSHIGAKSYLWQQPESAQNNNYEKPTGELVILPLFDGAKAKDYKLAYKYDIYATNPVSRGDLYIDAKTGEALFYNATIKHADSFGFVGKPLVTVPTEAEAKTTETFTAMVATGTAATRYSGSQTITTRQINGSFTLRDNTRGNGVNTYNSGGQAAYPSTNFTDADNNWTASEFDNSAKDNAALDAHWGAEVTYDYWQQIHNRNSFNGSGAAINSYVHYDDQPGGAGYDNAFWNGSVMTYGDGSSNGQEGNGFFDALTSLDVAAHEIGHAVTTFTANLAYQRESGGLNEGFSDIWGAAVEHFAKGNGNDANPSDAVWLIGDEIDRRSGSAALRSMDNPTSLGQPDTYGGQFWINPNCGTPTRTNDYCGVHTNSGVLNYWFYLLVEGGNDTNDVGDAFNVSGIGMNKAAQISYRTLSQYLSANSTFADARAAAIQSARDLYGAGGAEEQAVTNAWYAVNVGGAFGQIDYCSSNGNDVSDEYISRVQLADIDNTSGATSGGYQNSTATGTDLSKGTQYTLTITPTWTGTQYNEGYAAWIDYNNDGDFTDSGETLGTVAASQNSPATISFTVPSGATDGDTRLRVSMKYNGVPTSCESFSYGEVEDYTVSLGTSNADTQAPTAPTSLTASNITETTADLFWNASSDNVGVTAYDVYQGGSLLGSTANTTTQITGLTASTTYTFTVRAKDDAENVSGNSNAATFTTDSPATGGGCVNGISAFPYNEGYESNLGAWTQSTADDINWTRDASGTPSSNTGPSSATQGSFYVYVEASGNGTGYPNKQAILNSPCIDLSATSSPRFTFRYHMYGASDMGSFRVDVTEDDGSSWTNIFSQTGNKGNSWQSADIDLSAYNGSSIRLRFNRTTGSTWQADIAVDDVRVVDGPQDICAGVAPYSSSQSYSPGDRVTYQGSLYERQTNSWTNLGPCGSSLNGFAGDIASNGPPVLGEFTIFPNPVKGSTLKVSFTSNSSATYTIYNMVGQTVAKGKLDNTINVNNLESGVYLMNATIDGETVTKRFIKE